MDNSCKKCTFVRRTKFECTKWIGEFYQPLLLFLSEVDIKRCPCCKQLYQFSFVQCFVCSIFILLITMTSLFLTYIPLVGDILGLAFAIVVYPLALEIPRHCLPWKKVNESLLYSQWKSRLGLILAHILGAQFGLVIFLLIISTC